jgi:hypothetical protein
MESRLIFVTRRVDVIRISAGLHRGRVPNRFHTIMIVHCTMKTILVVKLDGDIRKMLGDFVSML